MKARKPNALLVEIGELKSQNAILRADYDRQIKINADLRERLRLISCITKPK